MKNTLQLFVKQMSPRTFEFQWFRARFNPFCCKTQVIHQNQEKIKIIFP